MRLRALVFAGLTSHASHVMPGCGSPEHLDSTMPPRPLPAVTPVPPAPAPGPACRPRSRTNPALAREAMRLERAMLEFQPLVVNRRNGKEWIRTLALHDVHVVESLHCETTPLLSREKDPYLLAAIQFHESSWHPRVLGQRGEVGLMQVHGVALQGRSRAKALEPVTNVRLGYEYLLRCRDLCGRGSNRLWLGAFASGACDTRVRAAQDFLDDTRTLLGLAASAASDPRS